ncbi:5-amino-6-(5-phospho-D-ribitylamino)uracil phosphatase YigB [Vibrio sp. Isolate23]|uniref:5-amino-6-(5-phospho-D-ribitylamino)uracil phosphatase YigB n=1 Tax=Vibrio sp. Isolate23 TaxID=2908533 RepID=UPI001EFD1B0F|nr:5-amino-6-(5-phospho-D-ribitylamino)uracil phosphatase YigB [Vibrio sp. Isolate23]MCG9685054.1 5-amino-6-(5-phospho-D-ribitylamino)uracil phosphatase YigB [Vibrio sp. Isolate23]
MHFYRQLPVIEAMTFDLDDTLYDNRPVIRRVETQVTTWLHKHHPLSASKPSSWWCELKMELAKADSWLMNDMTLWRQTQIEQGLYRLGYEQAEAKHAAEQAIEEVLRLRSDFSVPEQTHQVMQQLAKRIPLVAITNGNVDAERIGLSPYFSLILKAGPDGFAKPHPQMFNKAAQHLQCPAHRILHVGDHLVSDVQGAKRSGLSACWFNDQNASLMQHRRARSLPDVEIASLSELLLLIES